MWSRVGWGSWIEVSPLATSAASIAHDLTCAEATGSRYSVPCSAAPWTVNGGNRPSRASIEAPIARSGAATRSTGRRRMDASPSMVHCGPLGCPASQPGSRRMSVPALRTSMGASASPAARSPVPRITSSSGRVSTTAPTERTASSVAFVSPASR